MKKILISIAVLLMATTAFARPTGLNLGGGFAGNFMCLDGESNFFPGGYFEIGYDLTLGKHGGMYFGARTSALFDSEYRAGSIGGVRYAGEASAHLHYIDIPIFYEFVAKVSPKNKFFFNLGPTVNFWLIACSHYSATSSGVTVSERENWFDYDCWNRVNLSLGGNIGFIFNHVKVYAGYDQGLFSFTKKDYGFSNVGQLRVGAAFVF